MSGDRGNCRSCGAPLRWAVSIKTGGRMPLDVAPRDDGNVLIDGLGRAHVYGTHDDAVAARDEATDEYLQGSSTYIAHFATCPRADAHRRRQATVDPPPTDPQLGLL